jgi:hypothetical protein
VSDLYTPKESGLVHLQDTKSIRDLIDHALAIFDAKEKASLERAIDQVIEHASKPSWFGLVEGKTISRDYAFRELMNDEFGYLLYETYSEHTTNLKQIKQMCLSARQLGGEVWLSGAQLTKFNASYEYAKALVKND